MDGPWNIINVPRGKYWIYFCFLLIGYFGWEYIAFVVGDTT